MKRRIAPFGLVFAMALSVAGVHTETAGAQEGRKSVCECIANGQRIAEGETFCIRMRSGAVFLARCERVLNNTSWKRLQDGCPSAGLTPWSPNAGLSPFG